MGGGGGVVKNSSENRGDLSMLMDSHLRKRRMYESAKEKRRQRRGRNRGNFEGK